MSCPALGSATSMVRSHMPQVTCVVVAFPVDGRLAEGTRTVPPHLGQLPFLPAYFAATLILCSQLSQWNAITVDSSGTTIDIPHFGRLPFRPTCLSSTLMCRPQSEQVNLIIASPFPSSTPSHYHARLLRVLPVTSPCDIRMENAPKRIEKTGTNQPASLGEERTLTIGLLFPTITIGFVELNRWGQNMTDVTRILNAIAQGEAHATNELLPRVYAELRLLAAQKLSRERPGHTLQATALVHEAYIRLVEGGPNSWENRRHFFGAAAEAMRRILVESARSKRRAKRGGGHKRLELNDAVLAIEAPSDDILSLDEALAKLELEDAAVGELVKLRYLCGFSLGEVAQMLNMPRRTADRHWAYARAWLYQEMNETEMPEAT